LISNSLIVRLFQGARATIHLGCFYEFMDSAGILEGAIIIVMFKTEQLHISM